MKKSRSPPKLQDGRLCLFCLVCKQPARTRIVKGVGIDFTLYYLGDCWYFPNRQNKKSQSINLSNIERNEVKQYGNEICRARYGTVFKTLEFAGEK